jgi:hypothetical protein
MIATAVTKREVIRASREVRKATGRNLLERPQLASAATPWRRGGIIAD